MISPDIATLIPKIRAFLSHQPVLREWIFGSCSRGEETAGSDMDILVDYDDSHGRVSLFQMGGILMDLSDIVGRKVDLVDRKGLASFARPSVEKDMILIYERTD